MRDLSGRGVDPAALVEAAQRCLQAEQAQLDNLSLALVDDNRIIHLNEKLLGRSRPTDVIAFEAEDGEAEIIISVDTAQRQAQAEGHSLVSELRYLVAHGVLHVLGWDDRDEGARQRMLERQDEILEED